MLERSVVYAEFDRARGLLESHARVWPDDDRVHLVVSEHDAPTLLAADGALF